MTIKHRMIRLPHMGNAFADGMASVIDFGGGLNAYHTHRLVSMYDNLRFRRLHAPSGAEAESEAIRIVWEEVGQCLRDAIGAHANEPVDEHLPAEASR
ncbi:MAG: hypothetical protein OXL37_08205 [Chloroflexota bacterium]|nr:hypothetical protein [Chloroflexota bacterium]MDE2958630.1 hypothetical protein [Chloroflexota bacterium]